jgi:hypothetical protein
MSRVNIDSIGPLPPDEYGNIHILVLIDCFSRFVELYPIKAVDAKCTAPCLVDFVSRYGMPNYVLSDRGSQFCNAAIAETMRLLGTKHIDAMSYSKEENNKGEFHIDSILSHRGDWKRVSTLDFLVRWTGYDDSHNLWLPWKELRLTQQLHDYLRAQGKESLIPR